MITRPTNSRPVINHALHRSFGRVKGRVLRPAMQQLIDSLLPQLLIEDVSTDHSLWFDRSYTQYHLEIGFGGGEHLARMAKANPDIGFIGCEPYLNGVGLLLKQIDTEKLTNIRIFRGDARILLEHMPADILTQIYILFPDPWPKRKHHKKRLISAQMPALIAKVLKPQGQVFIATDHADYAGWILAHMLREQQLSWLAMRAPDWQSPPPGWQPTRYQQKALKAGRASVFFHFEKY